MDLNIPILNSNEIYKVNENIFGKEFNEDLVHQLVTRYLAGGRQGTKKQKTRSEVSGGGTKPWRQKGTGRARSGSSRSPIWRTGGVAFGSSARTYLQKLNKKMFRLGICSILSELNRQKRIEIVDSENVESIKTKSLISKYSLNNKDKYLIVVENIDRNLELSSRNIVNLDVISVNNINPVLLVNADKVLFSEKAIIKLEGSFV